MSKNEFKLTNNVIGNRSGSGIIKIHDLDRQFLPSPDLSYMYSREIDKQLAFEVARSAPTAEITAALKWYANVILHMPQMEVSLIMPVNLVN